MPGSLSYVPFVDQAAATRNFATEQYNQGGTTVEAYRFVSEGAHLPTYEIPISAAISSGTANSHPLQIMAGGTLDVLLVELYLDQFASAGSATVGQYGLYRLTSAGTGGTAITPAKMDGGDAASGCTAMTLPSAKGTESTLVRSGDGILLATAATAAAEPFVFWQWDWRSGKAPRIAAGTSNGLALKLITAIATGTLLGYARVMEVSYS